MSIFLSRCNYSVNVLIVALITQTRTSYLFCSFQIARFQISSPVAMAGSSFFLNDAKKMWGMVVMERNSTCIFFYYTVSGRPCTVYTYWDILTEKIWQILIRQWILTNQRSERCFSLVKKKKSPITIANDVFSSVRKMIRLIKSHRGVWVSRQNSCLL